MDSIQYTAVTNLDMFLLTRWKGGVGVTREEKKFHYDFWVANILYF